MEIDLHKLHVLVVEDNTLTLKLIQAVLKDMSVGQVYTARDGREAQTFLDAGEDLINLIICDWNMPRMSGLDLLKQVRMAHPDLPFLMVTARGTIDSVVAAKKSGVSGYVVKPFSPAELEQKVVALARRIG
ncbi:MAG: response regulator [Limibaculum sp.]|jgi:DNA-binding response OmpR family regulator